MRGGWRLVCLTLLFVLLSAVPVQGAQGQTGRAAGVQEPGQEEKRAETTEPKQASGAADVPEAGQADETAGVPETGQADGRSDVPETGQTDETAGAQETDHTVDAAALPDAGKLTDELLDELELGEMEDFLREQEADAGLDMSFTELLKSFVAGEGSADFGQVWEWCISHSLGAVQKNKSYLAQMLILLLAFAMLQGISGIFADSFLSDISFLAVYFLFLYNALRIFASMQDIVYDCIGKIADFTLLVQPIFCMAMIFSTGISSASLTYEMTLLVLYLVQNLLQKLLLPLVFLFLITQFANYAWKEEHFSSMAKLLESGVGLAQKVLVTFILGMNLIQGMVAPALDQLKKTAAVRTVGLIPGLGGAMNAVSEMLLGTGLLIKNCVGVTVLVLLILLCAKPLLEIVILAFLYRLLAAVAEPVTDKRISGVLDALARAGMLYVKLVVTAVLMLFLTVAVVCVATSAMR